MNTRGRRPYQTMTRERGALYLRECVERGRDPRPSEMVQRGIGANWKSAQRILAWLVDANLTYREMA